jgi:hypothetical protein
MTRTILPARRPHETIRFRHWDLNYVAGIGFLDHEPMEVFLNCGKSGTQAETLARDSAVLLSIALQHGVPIEEMQHAITRNVDGSPQGPIGRLLDLIGEGAGDACSTS